MKPNTEEENPLAAPVAKVKKEKKSKKSKKKKGEHFKAQSTFQHFTIFSFFLRKIFTPNNPNSNF